MKRIVISFLLLSFSVLSASDCGVNVYNVATGKIHKKYFVANHVHPQNKKIVSERCFTDVIEDDQFNKSAFKIVANCSFKDDDMVFRPATKTYEMSSTDDYEGYMAIYSYNLFAYEILCVE